MSLPVQPTTDDRVLAALRALLRAEFPQLTYLGVYEYVVHSTDGSTVDCIATDASVPLPSLAGVPIRSDVIGATVKPRVGGRCLIAFVNADPSRPIVVSSDPPPQLVEIGESTDFVALARRVLSELQSIKTAFDSHIHPASTPNAGTPAIPMPTPSSVAAARLKVD